MTGHNTSETPRFSNTPNVGAGTGTGTSTSTGLGDNSHLGDSARHGDSLRPQVNSGVYDGNSDASIKSGVIGFAPGEGGQEHAALPSNSSAEDRLDRNQVVGQGNTGTNTGSGLRNEVPHEQPSTLPGR